MKITQILKSALLVCLFSVSTAKADIIVSFEQQTSSPIFVNDSFLIDVFVNTGVDSFTLFDLGLSFDPAVASLDSATANAVSFIAATPTLDFAGFALDPFFGASGADLLLGTLSFTATSAGTFGLDVASGLFNNGFSSVAFSSQSLSLDVQPSAAVPAPSVFALFALAGVVMLRRRVR